MFNKTIIIVLFLCVSISPTNAEEIIDLNQLTSECVDAANRFQKIQNNVSYKVLHTVEYEGWTGDANNFKLLFPVVMTIRYAGVEKNGYYWLRNNPQKKYFVSAKVDFEGNFELVETAEGRQGSNRFHGIMKEGVIKGLWKKEGSKKSFAFYVKVSNYTSTHPHGFSGYLAKQRQR